MECVARVCFHHLGARVATMDIDAARGESSQKTACDTLGRPANDKNRLTLSVWLVPAKRV
jgi:hypothetical protein